MSRPIAGSPTPVAITTLVIVAPMPPLVTNREHGRSRHWRVAHQEKVEYWATLDTYQRLGGIPAPPRAPFPRARLTSHMTLRGGMDDDNALARHKWLLDWLVSRGYLAGDRKKHLTWTGMPEQLVTRKQPAMIRLTIEPVTQP